MNRIICVLAVVAAVAMADDQDIGRVFKQSNDQFTAKFFSEVVKNSPGQSVVMSAFSVIPPLSQLALASSGESHDELLKVIGFPNDNVTKQAISDISTKLRSAKGVILKMANRIYVANDAQLNDEYAALSRDVFDSDVKSVDFTASKSTAGEINAWVEDKTNNRIKDLVSPDSLTSDTRAVLVNAIYFKGSWKDKFNKDLTRDRDFHVTKDKTIQVPTMVRHGDYRYGESAELDAKILELPYEGEESSMVIVLPNAIDGINGLVEKLKDPAALPKALEHTYTVEVDVQLPRFKIETTTNLKDVLQKINVKRLFSPAQARLDHLLKGESNLFISDAIQKAFIEVNEEGAEAAAANEFNISLLIGGLPEVYNFEADHPFVFFIRAQNNDIFNGIFLAE